MNETVSAARLTNVDQVRKTDPLFLYLQLTYPNQF